MTPVVLDASATLPWFFLDEASPASDALLDRVRDQGALVPGLWHLEVANVLQIAIRRGRITGPDADERMDLVASLPVSVDPETHLRAWSATRHLAMAESLSAYDAAYLELALRSSRPLATADRALVAAALRRGVHVLPD